MTYRAHPLINDLLKGDVNKGKYELLPFIPSIRNTLMEVYELNKDIIEYLKLRPDMVNNIATISSGIYWDDLSHVLKGTDIVLPEKPK